MKELVCPLCHSALDLNNTGLACANLHHFDRAREGYFNLLPAQHKNSKQPGESKEQLQARRKFLLEGYFDPLAKHLLENTPRITNSLVDLGCGEGYFSLKLAQQNVSATSYAVDISKAAIQMVAKSASHNLVSIVASNYQLPFATASIGLVTRILAPSIDAEVFRILSAGGLFIVVRPQGEHLVSLRRRIYSDVKPYQESKIPDGFLIQKESSLRFEISISDPQDAAALLKMTPFAWRLKQEDLETYCVNGWQDVAEFNIAIYQKA